MRFSIVGRRYMLVNEHAMMRIFVRGAQQFSQQVFTGVDEAKGGELFRTPQQFHKARYIDVGNFDREDDLEDLTFSK